MTLHGYASKPAIWWYQIGFLGLRTLIVNVLLTLVVLGGCGGAIESDTIPEVQEPGTTASHPESVREPDPERPDVVLPPGAERAWVTLAGKRELRLTVEVLRTDKQFDRGLMYRTDLPREAGVLFLFPQQGDHVFWMKNVSIPLDIVFADKDWNVVGVEHDTVPYSEASLSAAKPSKYVVEMNAGLASAYGIEPGSRLTVELDRESCDCKEGEK